MDSSLINKKTTTLTARVSIWKHIRKCYSYRELIWELVRKDIKVKYTQTKFGIVLSLLQPVIGLLMFVYLFGKLLHIGSEGMPYPVFVFTGMITWYYFSLLVNGTGHSLIESQHIIKKVYFPKLVLPVSKVFSSMFEFFIWFIVWVFIYLFYGMEPTYRLLFVPLFFIMIVVTGFTIGTWLSALSFYKRDVLLIIPYLVGLTIMVTPVFYPKASIPEHLDFLIYLNPVAGIIQGFRWCITGGDAFSVLYIPSFVCMFIFFFLSLIYFKRVEYRMAEKL